MSGLFISTVILFFLIVRHCLPAWREKQWRLLALNILFLTAGYIILSMSSLDITIPSPLDPIEKAIRHLFNMPL